MSSQNTQKRLSVLPRTEVLEAIQVYLIDCQARKLSPRTIERYQDLLSKFRQWLEACQISELLAITPAIMRAYLVELGESHNTGGVHIYFRTIRTWLYWCKREYRLERWEPLRNIKVRKPDDEPLNPVPIADVKAMLDTCKERRFLDMRDKAVLLCLLDTGARAAEFLGLNIGDVDPVTGVVRIRDGKGGRPRTVFLGAKSRRELTRYIRRFRAKKDAREPLWVGHFWNRLSYSGLRQIIKRRARLAGVHAHPLHAFRRAFAILSLKGGADLESLRLLLGHRDTSVIRRYLKFAQDDLRAIHQRSSPVDNLL